MWIVLGSVGGNVAVMVSDGGSGGNDEGDVDVSDGEDAVV